MGIEYMIFKITSLLIAKWIDISSILFNIPYWDFIKDLLHMSESATIYYNNKSVGYSTQYIIHHNIV